MRSRTEGGIALPVTIFIITLVTITLAAAFARVGAEREMAVGASEATSALTVAQSGLQRYLGTTTSRPPDGDSVRFNVTGGYADVVARIVESDSLDDYKTMYIIRSTGYIIVPAQGAAAQGKRTVAQFAQWQVGTIRRVAAFTAANRLRRVSSGTVTISGTDACAAPALPLGSVRTRWPASPSTLTPGTYSPTPPIVAGTGDEVADTTGIDWVTIVNGGMQADYSTLGTDPWKSYLIAGDATINGWVGSGLLIVTGDLTTQGSAPQTAGWDGVVLVGGRIIPDARNTRFRGLVYSGLNELLTGPPPPQGDIGGGPPPQNFTVEYWSCYADSALAPLTGLVPVRNAWVDNWASY